MGTASTWQNRLNQTLSGAQSAVGVVASADAIGNIFGVSVADAIGIDQSNLTDGVRAGGFNVQNFVSKVGTSDIMRTTLFLTSFGHPKNLQSLGYGTSTTETVRLMAEAFSLPGVSWATSDNIRRYGYGQIEARPHTPLFSDIAFSFLVDGKGEIFRYFNNWMTSTIGYDVGGRNSQNPDQYLVSYKTDYVTDIELLVYNHAAKKIMSCRLRDAFPVSIDPIQMSWGSNDEVARLIVTFKFTDYTTQTYYASEDITQELSFLQRLEQGKDVVQTLSSLTKPESINDVISTINQISVIRSGINLF